MKRKCEICGKEITAGYVFDGAEIFCSIECATKFFDNDRGCVEILLDDGDRLVWHGEITEKLVVMFRSEKIGLCDCLICYDRDIEIDEGNFWKADGIEADEDMPFISIYGDLDEENHPTTNNLVVYIEHSANDVETIRDIRVLECV